MSDSWTRVGATYQYLQQLGEKKSILHKYEPSHRGNSLQNWFFLGRSEFSFHPRHFEPNIFKTRSDTWGLETSVRRRSPA